MVNLSKSLKLYLLVGKYLPTDEGFMMENIYQFTGKILQEMINDNHHEYFIDAIQCMTDIPESTLVTMSIDELNKLFMMGLIENEIFSLHEFMRNFVNVTF